MEVLLEEALLSAPGRSVHAKGGNRYGEEFDLAEGSTENLYLIKASENPWVLIGAFSEDSTRGLMSEMLAQESGLADRIGVLMLQFFDGGQVPSNGRFQRLQKSWAVQPWPFWNAAPF